jgi:hypothetical protein
MSKPAPNAAAQYHRCPNHKDQPEIRVKGFAYCPFCGAKVNADGDHNVVVAPDIVDAYRAAQQAAQPRPDPIPESPKPEPPKPAPEPPRVKSAEEIKEMIDKAFPKPPPAPPPITLADPVVPGSRPQKPRSSVLPLLIFAALILGGGYYAWTLTQPQAPIIAPSVFDATLSDPAAEGVALADTGGAPNPDITSAGVTLEPRSVTTGLKREIRFNNANIRALPTQDSKILDQLQRGAIISPTGRITDLRGNEQGEWYRVEEHVIGFVRFGNTKAVSAPKPAKPVAVKTFEVEPPGLRVMAEKTLRIRTTPSRADNSNFTGNHVQLGQIFTPREYAMDMGKDPGRRWYKIPGGYVAEWETKKLDPASTTPVDSPEPSPRAAVDPASSPANADRAQSSTTRALDALRRPRDPAPN